MDNEQIRCVGVDWIQLAQGRNQRRALVDTAMNLSTP
jgi:hypothetical protein